MSSEYAVPSYQADSAKCQSGLRIGVWVLGILVLLAAAFVTLHVVAQLDAMSASLARVSTSLDSLKTMNQKLDMLSGMSLTLHQMNDKLSVTNRSLDVANQKLSLMARDSKTAGSSLDGMQRTLTSMRSDIAVMSHKISGSFLFRSVK